MGSGRTADIVAWQEAAGLEEATGGRADILRRMSDAAFELIKVVELERSGIRDGDGRWGSDVIGHVMGDLRTFMHEFDRIDRIDCGQQTEHDEANEADVPIPW